MLSCSFAKNFKNAFFAEHKATVFAVDQIMPRWYLSVQRQQLKQKDSFKVNEKDNSSDIFIFSFEHISHIALVFPLLTLNK